MSLRPPSILKWASVAPVIAVLLCLGGIATAAPGSDGQPAVQNYVEQVVPVTDAPPQGIYDSPLSAGTLTLQDVLEAHKPATPLSLPAPNLPTPSSTATAPLLTPSAPSSTSLMMSQGMKAVLQKVGETAPAGQATPTSTRAQAAPTSLMATPATPAVTADGTPYQPGQEPKNLATGAAEPVSVGTAPGVVAPTAGDVAPATNTTTISKVASGATAACDESPQKWEKACSEVGYPANYIGKIVGETRTTCADGTLHDFWVNNSCAPPDALSASTPGTDAVCGAASNNEYDNAPTSNLCAQGVASAVSGDGPWTWACSGVNGGDAAACTARQRTVASNGSCGSANGEAASSAPTSNLCNIGYATQVNGSGPWSWSCHGTGKGSTESCIAPLSSDAVAADVPVVAAAPVVKHSSKHAAETPAPQAVTPAPQVPPSSEKGELCGEAAETLAYQAPDKDLCRVGNASLVNGDGPWTWSCTDNDGRSSSCRTLSLNGDATAAPAAEPASPAASPPEAVSTSPVATSPRIQPSAVPFAAAVAQSEPAEPACGLSASQPTLQAPVSDLCAVGKSSSVRGSGPWSWTCNKSHRKVSCETPKVVDGSCGPANGSSLKSAPFAGLCSSGTPTGIEGDGPWNWSCNGAGGGVNVSCAAAVQGKVAGTCGTAANTTVTSAPSADLCASGNPSAVGGMGPWNWSCSGSNGGGVSTCSASKASAPAAPGNKVDGLCGSSNGVTSASQPTDGLCSAGSATDTVGNGPWNWNCIGENGGMSVSCTAPLEPPAPLDGACGAANGVPTLVVPQSALCSSGITGRVNGKGPWNWTCSGVNGGNAASCVAPVAGKTGSLPSKMTSKSASVVGGDDLDNLDATPPAPTGLVTPRLPNSSATIPALDRKTIPSLTPSTVPAPAVVSSYATPVTPGLADTSTPMTPPPSSSKIVPSPVLQDEAAASVPHTPGNHLTLDPTISTILFTRGSGNIDDQVLTTLDRLSAVLTANGDVRITLIAYADNGDSTPRDARRLSLTRALAVRDYLGSKGIVDSRVDVRAEGANSTSGYIDRVDVKVND